MVKITIIAALLLYKMRKYHGFHEKKRCRNGVSKPLSRRKYDQIIKVLKNIKKVLKFRSNRSILFTYIILSGNRTGKRNILKSDSIFEEALAFAAKAHSGQRRKTGDLPYILHPIEVSSIVSTMTEDREVLAAALLHDVVEDTAVTADEIEERFGERIARLVAGDTENKRPELPAEATWKLRKEESLAELRETADPAVKMLWLSDKLSNFRSIYRSYRKIGDDAFNVFHQKDKKMHEWYYRTVAEYTKELGDTAAYEEYVSLLDLVFGGNGQ